MIFYICFFDVGWKVCFICVSCGWWGWCDEGVIDVVGWVWVYNGIYWCLFGEGDMLLVCFYGVGFYEVGFYFKVLS